MTKFRVALCLLTMVFFSCSKAIKPTPTFLEKGDTSYAPPGTIKLADNRFIDKQPVTNEMYKEFLRHRDYYWTTASSKMFEALPTHNSPLPDEIKVLQQNSYADALSSLLNIRDTSEVALTNGERNTNFLDNPTYAKHPVLGINYKETVLFCKWRSELATLRLNHINKTKKSREQFPKKLHYRLPSKDEFIKVINHFKQINRLKHLQVSEAGTKNRPEGYLITYNLDELLNDGSLFNIQSESIKNDTLSKSKTSFRCICETEAW